MFRYIILCLFLSTQSCNLDDTHSTDSGKDTNNVSDTGDSGNAGDFSDAGDSGEDASEDVTIDLPPASAGCLDYCAKVDTTCTGTNALYPDNDACLAACSGFTDRSEAAGAFTGNTLQCRIYHINAASANPTVHCSHGSEESIPGKCRDFQTLCSTYCGELSELCVADFEEVFGADSIATLQNCINSCPGTLPDDGTPMANDTTDTVNCRLSQLTQQNCDGGKVASDVCVDPFIE